MMATVAGWWERLLALRWRWKAPILGHSEVVEGALLEISEPLPALVDRFVYQAFGRPLVDRLEGA
ncbi:MAG: hypothetical protein GEU28_13025 [Dehalococcoidia bacterium]|nr:hypothetical protein [Dehalococcoidia bacterium]